MRILAVDHGEKRIGLALSDERESIASPLEIIAHVSRVLDAARVAQIAQVNAAAKIVIGQSFDDVGNPNAAGRRAARFADELRVQTSLPIELWDESFSTQDAHAARIEMGVSKKRRGGHHDDFAAAMILQSYLDAQHIKDLH